MSKWVLGVCKKNEWYFLINCHGLNREFDDIHEPHNDSE